MSLTAKRWGRPVAAPNHIRRGGIEISTFAKWVLLIIFLILVIIILIKVNSRGDGTISSLCALTGGLIGC